MKALIKAKREPGLWLEDIEVPRIGINDVLIRIHRTGICGTDLHIYNWDECMTFDIFPELELPLWEVFGRELTEGKDLLPEPLT